MNKTFKLSLLASAALVLVGCGDDLTITKPAGEHEFKSAETPTTREVKTFSKAEVDTMTKDFKELSEAGDLVTTYIRSAENIPTIDSLPPSLKNESSVTTAMTAFIAETTRLKAIGEEKYEKQLSELQDKVKLKEDSASKVFLMKEEADKILAESQTAYNEAKSASEIASEEEIKVREKIAATYNKLILAESLPINKMKSGTFSRYKTIEGACDSTGYVKERWGWKFKATTEDGKCVVRGVPFDKKYIDKFNTEEQVKELTEHTLAQQKQYAAYSKAKSDMKTASNKMSDDKIIIRNKFNTDYRNMTRNANSAKSAIEYAERKVNDFVEKHERFVFNQFGSIRDNQLAKLKGNYTAALNTILTQKLTDSFKGSDVSSGAKYAAISFPYEEEKPYAVVFDEVSPNHVEIFVFKSADIKEKEESLTSNGEITLESVGKAKLANGDLSSKDDKYEDALRLLKRMK